MRICRCEAVQALRWSFYVSYITSGYDASAAACGVITGAEQTGVCLSKLDVHETILIGPGCAPCLLRVRAPVSPGCRPLRPRAARVCSRVCAPRHQIKRGIGEGGGKTPVWF